MNDPVLEVSIENLQKIAEICETRLEMHNSQESGTSNEEYWVFPAHALCLYHHMLGDTYLKLYRADYQTAMVHSKHLVRLGDRCVQVLEEGLELANDQLPVTHETRLLLSFAYCDALVTVKKQPRRAKAVAQKMFDLATANDQELSEQSMNTLQKLRDHFMTFVMQSPPKSATHGKKKDVDSRGNEHLGEVSVRVEVDDDEVADDADETAIDELFHTKKRSKKSKEIEDIRNQRMAKASSNKRLMHARTLRRIVTVPLPVNLDSIASAQQLLKALDRIFRVYIRGNALPGQLHSGDKVDLAGQTMTFRRFVLDGPYLSWKGFVSFLMDFRIASLPDPDSKSGKSFLASINSKQLSQQQQQQQQSSSSGDAVLEMNEAAMLFIEASRSASPVLVLNKFLPLYAEIATQLESDPWNAVYEWAELPSPSEWDIPCGVNFMQFLDCIGKMGTVAYSSGLFEEMLPTVHDKVEHFLTAFLGLADNRRWQNRVEAKLQIMNKLVKQLSSACL